MKKKEPGNEWKLKMLTLEVFETPMENYRAIWETRKRLQAKLNWRWSIIRDHHGSTQVKRIEDVKSN